MVKFKEKYKKYIVIAVAAVLSAAIFAMTVIYMWKCGMFLPKHIMWQDKDINCAIELSETVDANNRFGISLHDKELNIYRNETLLWQSGNDYKVQDVLVDDIDNDGRNDLLVLCWKIGKYGRYKPFWVDSEENNWRQHIYIYDISDKGINDKWLTSDIGREVRRWSIDNRHFLFVEDGDGITTMWRWEGFGLKNLKNSLDIVAVGDNIIHKPIYEYGIRNHSFDFMYKNIAGEVKNADIAIIGQESILVNDSAQYTDFPRFGAPKEVADAVSNAGFDVVLLANNHVLDKGKDAIKVTTDAFDKLGIKYVGIKGKDKPYEIITKNGIKVAILNYTYGINGIINDNSNNLPVYVLADEDAISQDINDADKESDIVVVCVHWGEEYSTDITENQKYWKDIFVSAGADVVIGAHPHVVQKYEAAMDSDGNTDNLVFYSLGNFISTQTGDSAVGGLARFTITNTMDGVQITSYDLNKVITRKTEDNKYYVDFLDK